MIQIKAIEYTLSVSQGGMVGPLLYVTKLYHNMSVDWCGSIVIMIVIEVLNENVFCVIVLLS